MKFVSIADDVKLGKDVKVFNFVNLYGCTIGDGTKLGTFVEVQKGAAIGKNCKISSHFYAFARKPLRTFLPYDDIACSNSLATVFFHAQALGLTVTSVAGTTATLLVRHLTSS